MHFERLVLTALRDSPDTESWSRKLQAEISAITGDDAAMALLGVGADHDGFRELFAERTAAIEERWVAPLDAMAADVERAERELEGVRQRQSHGAAELWQAYKAGYESYLGSDGESAAAEETP